MNYFKKKWIGTGTVKWDKENETLSFHKNQNEGEHLYLGFTDKPIKGMTSFASILIINHYLTNNNRSINQWRKEKQTFIVKYSKENKKSKPFNYLKVSDYIRQKGYFDCYDFDLYPLNENWLDENINFFQMFHKTLNEESQFNFSEGNIESNFGEKFPLRPSISREGFIISSFLHPLLDRIVKKRFKLVEESNKIFSLDWIFELKDIVNDAVSSVDIFLNSIYLKAQYDPLPGWKFDSVKLGNRYSRRLRDKLKWVYQISGNKLEIESEIESLIMLKNLRNHLNHYDPPCLALTIEEISKILNDIINIGIIHIKIREALKIKTCSLLVNFILQPEICFIPEQEFLQRSKLDDKIEGYNTSTWNKSEF